MIPRNLLLDHFALRVLDRERAVASYLRMGYDVNDEFDLVLEDGSSARSYALVHDENPEVFITSGMPGGLIHGWVMNHGGVGAIHHLAYAVDDVDKVMREWMLDGVRFDREEPLVCSCPDPLVQIFTEPDPATGLIYELITRNGHPGFCKENVRRLMDGSVG